MSTNTCYLSSFSHSHDTLYSADIDECIGQTHGCNENAICTNTIGSHACVCQHGFEGDGQATCKGIVWNNIITIQSSYFCVLFQILMNVTC